MCKHINRLDWKIEEDQNHTIPTLGWSGTLEGIIQAEIYKITNLKSYLIMLIII